VYEATKVGTTGISLIVKSNVTEPFTVAEAVSIEANGIVTETEPDTGVFSGVSDAVDVQYAGSSSSAATNEGRDILK
jgi:hypothetical protein